MKDKALDVRALVIDDVGTKGPSAGAVELALGRPTAIAETSLGNFQWAYRLSSPVAVGDWDSFFAGIEALIGHARPLEARAAQTLMRLPMGVNTKPQNNRFAVRLAELNPGIELDPATIARVRIVKSAGPVGPSEPIRNIKAMVALLPNDFEYDEWIAVGQRIKARAADDEDGREAWHELSSRTTLKVYDPDYTERKWHSFTADHTRGGLLVDAVQKLGGAAVEAWWQGEAAGAFDDGADLSFAGPGSPKRAGITATPFKWMDLAKTAPRDWLYGDILLRKFISMTVAPGGVGKSSLVAVETLAQVTGKSLLGEDPSDELRVWLWNLEDPYEETQKKILAAAKHYGIAEAEIGDRLFVDSGRDQRLVIAEMDRTGPMIVRPVVRELVEQIKARKIDVVVIDPFVSSHGVPENDNGAMDMVVKEWGRVAEEGGCAVHLVDHTSKAGSAEVVTDSSRGAKAKTDAARVVRVVNRMTAVDGKAYGILEPWRYFNTFNDKANMAPPKAKRDWFRMESVSAGNGGGAAQAFSVGAAGVPRRGDSVGVATQWFPPTAQALAAGGSFVAMQVAMEGKEWRKDVQTGDQWIGNAAGKALNLNPKNEKERAMIKKVVGQWLEAGLLREVWHDDQKRMSRAFIEIAEGY